MIFVNDSEGRALPGPNGPEIINFIINSITIKSWMKHDKKKTTIKFLISKS